MPEELADIKERGAEAPMDGPLAPPLGHGRICSFGRVKVSVWKQWFGNLFCNNDTREEDTFELK